MKLYYCDVCGLRIPAAEIPPDDPEPEDGKYFCAQHRAAPLPKQQAKPPSASVLQVPIPNSGNHPRTKIPSGTRASSPRITPAHPNPAQHPVKPTPGNKNVIIFGAAGVVFVVLAATIAFSGGRKPPAERETSVTQAPPAAPLTNASAVHPEPARAVDPGATTALPTGPGFLAPYAATPERPTTETIVKPPGNGTAPAAPDTGAVNPLPDKPLPAPAITPAPPSNPLNLLKDPGFESGNATTWLPYGDAKVIEDPAKAHSGKFCTRLRSTGETMMRQVVTGLTPGGRYIASGWIKGTNGSLGVKEFIGPSSTVDIVKSATQSDEYQLVSIPFTMGPTWKSAKIFFRCTSSKEDVFVDDAMLVADTGSPDAGTPDKAPGAPAEIKPPEDTPAQKFETLREKAYALLQQGKSEAGLAAFTEAKADPQFATLAAELDTAAALVKTYDAVLAAAPDGLKKLSDGRAFTFKKKDKSSREIPVGGATKASVAEFKDGDIVIETKDGGMVATQKIVYDDLSEQCRLDLAALALPPGPESDLKLAFAEFLLLRSGRTTASAGLHAHLERVKKDSTTAPGGEFLQRELDLLAVNQHVDAVTAKIDAAVKEGNSPQARTLYAEMKKEFGATPPLRAKRYLDEHKDLELQAGLWTSYFSGPTGKEFDKYHLSRVETHLAIEWGYKSPDPSVPVDYFVGKFCGILRVEKAGTYTFTSKTDDYIDLSVDGQRVLENYSNSFVSGKIALTAGDHPIRVYYRELTYLATLSLKWKLEGGFDTQDIPASALWHDPSLREQYQKPSK